MILPILQSSRENTAPLRILMIEDNSGDVQLIREMLASQDNLSFELENVGRLALGLQRLSEQPPDVILLDLSLPDGRGIEILDQLRAQITSVPVIVLTGTDDEQLAVSAVRQGAQDYLVKGKVDRSLLLRSIRYAMERQRLLLDILEQKKGEEQIRASLKEKDVLLKEIHHRVKNNLQIISSLLKLHTGSLKDERDMEVFKDCQNKIKAMALIHEILYQLENLAKINFSEYTRKLTMSLLHSYGVKSNAITLHIQADNILLGVDVAIPCGLIVNELVSNSIKHAFPGKKNGRIWIDFSPNANRQRMTMTVGDNGIGFPKGLDIQNIESMGLRLVSTLTDQLGGSIEVKHDNGTEIRVIFPTSGE